jgi:hypothetical protein
MQCQEMRSQLRRQGEKLKDETRPLSDGEIESIMSPTEFLHYPADGTYVMASLHPGFDDIPADITLSIGYGMSCCAGVTLEVEAARELARTLLRAADVLEAKAGN